MQRTSNILVRSLLSATSLLGGLAMVHGQAVTVDGTRDYLYGFPRVWQTVQTGFGENLSELDNAYSYIGGGKLNLFLGSNLEGNGNRIYVFLDTNSASGQNVLRGDNGDGALNALAGLKLEPGFAPDHGFVFNTGGGVNLYANYGSLPAGAGGIGEYLGNSLVGGGSGTLTGSSNLMGVMASFNNSNAGGVGGGTSDNQVPSDVATGLEISIPLGSLGIVDQSVKVFAFISDNTGLLSNQFLPDVGNGTSHGIYGSPGVVDFGDAGHPGKQFFYVQPRTKNAFWATRVSSFGTASLGSGAAGPAAIVRLDPATPNQSPTDLISLSGGVSGSRASSLGNYAYSDYLKRTSDGTKALYFGYSAAPGDAGVGTTTGRTLAWVSGDQSLTFRNFTTTANSNRGAVSFEPDFAFFANSGSQLQLSSPTTTTLVSSPNARVLNTFNNRLYWGGSSSVNAFQFIPTGSATSASIGSLGLSNAQDFTFADARTLYVLRDSVSSGVTSAVCKYVYSGVTSTWGLAYVLESSLLGSSYARALQIAKTSSGIDLFVTTGTSGQSANNRVYKITDNGTSLAVVSTLTTLAGANVSYRGIDWSPELWQAPVANHDTASTDDATPINGNAATNDTGEYKQGYAAISTSGPGSFSLNPDGTYTYTPDGNPGTAILTYKFNDTDQDSNQATVTVTVTGGNTAPVANDASFTTDEGTIVNTPVVASDADNDVLTYSIVTPPAHGTIGGTAPNWTYTPSGVFSGPDSFVFKVNDGTEDSNNATVTLSVNDTIGMGVDVKTSPAPNFYGSPNYDDWEARALDRWLNADGAPQFLRSDDPTAFETPSTLVWSDATVTNFPFWLGVLNPTLPFAAELGHRPTFTTRVLGHGTRFSLHGLEFDIHSNDPALDENDYADMFGWNGWWDGTDPGDPGQQYYNAWTVGIDYGPDRIRSTWGDNLVYEDGEAAELPIDELVYVGLGYAFEAVTTVSQTDPVVALRETRAYFERKIAATGSQVDINVTFKMHAGDVGDPVLGQGTQVVPLISNNVAPTAFGLVTAVDENSVNNPINVTPATDPNSFEMPLQYEMVDAPDHGSLSGAGPNWVYTPSPTYAGPDSFTYRVKDVTLYSAPATVNIAVNNTNDPPVANNASYSASKNMPIAATGTAIDPDGDVMTYTVVAPPAHGTLSGTAPNWVFTPATNYVGSDSFSFKANDGFEDSNTATISLTVTDSGPITIESLGSPAPNAYGSPSWSGYRDNALLSLEDPAHPDILSPLTDPTAYETPETIPWFKAVATPFGFWMNTLHPSAPFANEYGHRMHFGVHILGNGTRFSLSGLDFDMNSSDPNNDMNFDGWFDGTDPSWPYPDFYGPSRVGIDYGPDRIKDTGDDVVYNTDDIPAEMMVDELMYVGIGNAWDATYEVGDTDYEKMVSTRAYLETMLATGPIEISTTYTMHEGDHASPVLGSATGSVDMVSTNVPPTGATQNLSMDENSSLPVTLSATDSDNFEVPLTFAYGQPAHGTVTGTAPNVTYTPNANYTGPDSFTYTATDVYATSAPITVNIAVNGTNDPPVASNASYTTDENTPVAATGSATDPNGDTMTYTVVTPPTHGLLSGTAPNWVYTPNANFAGADSFTFKANDGSVDSNVATVSLTVNDTIGMAMQAFVSSAPNAYGSPSFVGWRDRALNSLENTPGIEDGSRLSDPTAYEIVNAGPWWEAVVTGFPSWLGGLNPVAPFDGEYGHRVTTGLHILGHGTQFKLEDLEFDMSSTDPTNTLTYVGDFVGLTYAPHRVGIDYGPDRIKGTGDDLRYNTTATPGSVMIDELVYVGVGNSWAATVPEVGATPYEAMQSVRAYIESVLAGQPLDITTSYAIRPGHTGSPLATASDTLHLVSTNTAPLADDQTVSVGEDGSTGITLSGSDGDLYEIPLEYTVTGGPSNGTLSGTAPNLVYTPDPNYFGPDSFTFVTTDVALDSLEATVTINVTPVNDPPILNSIGNQPVYEGSDLIINLGGSDIDSTTLTYSATGMPAGATLVGNTFSWNPSEIQGPGVYPVTFEVNDGAGGMDSELVVITVAEVNIAPAASNQSVATDVNELVNISLVATDEDLPANTLTYTIVSLPTHGTLSQTGADVTYTPDLDYSGPDSFTFKANDGTVDSNVATVNISVAGTTITLDLTLQGYLPDGETIRGMTMWLGGTTGGANPPVDVSRDVTFDSSGHATIVFVSQDGFLPTDDLSTYAISVKDDLHTLRKMEMLHWDGDNYTANVTLVGGNLNRDNKVDIADYVVYAVRSGQTVDPNTPLALHANPLFRHADISGDGDVDSEEFSFIQATFGQFDDDLVGNYSRGNDPIRVRIKVSDAILESGTKNAALLDRNRDGWITMDEAKTPLSPTRR